MKAKLVSYEDEARTAINEQGWQNMKAET